PALAVAAGGLATAWLAAQVQVTTIGATATGPWPGAPLSLYWLGLVGAAIVGLEAIRRAAVGVGSAAVVAATLAVAPLLGALVLVAGSRAPGLGTLGLTAEAGGSLAVQLQRGEGTTLDDQSALHAGRTEVGDEDRALAELAGNLASRGGFDPVADLQHFQIGFVLVTAADPQQPDAVAVRERAVASLDAAPQFAAASESGYGSLWVFAGLERHDAEPPSRGAYGYAVLAAQAVVVLIALLLAIPTRRRR